MSISTCIFNGHWDPIRLQRSLGHVDNHSRPLPNVESGWSRIRLNIHTILRIYPCISRIKQPFSRVAEKAEKAETAALAFLNSPINQLLAYPGSRCQSVFVIAEKVIE